LNGSLNLKLKNKKKNIKINRIHIEEDTARSIYYKKNNSVHLDFNRAGMPLLEIVTTPSISNRKEAIEFLKTIKKVTTSLNMSNGNMNEGKIRTDVNVSIKKISNKHLGTKVEIKNINSIKSINQSIKYEINRQKKIITNNKQIKQETRFWDQFK
jgi:aspartyl-tRNA(Asn)/glutamyl-tRNA(Gln) amidotransferase subunit B